MSTKDRKELMQKVYFFTILLIKFSLTENIENKLSILDENNVYVKSNIRVHTQLVTPIHWLIYAMHMR